jgi:ABC-type branched-subunit amino acid transport system substrate-binding protein
MRNQLHSRVALTMVAVVAILGGSLVASGTAAAQGSVRGFDGSTITLGSIGIPQLLPGATPGVEARIKRFNDTHEVKGVTLKFLGQVDDNRDPATSLNEARRLVTQDQVFALVGETSTTDPGDYFKQQHVPYFGGGFNSTFCANTPDAKSIWGFGTYGCTTPSNPPYTGPRETLPYEYAKKQLGKEHPTAALIINDSDTGRNGLLLGNTQMTAAGFKVVYAKAALPNDVSDYTPYVQAISTSDNGHMPDMVRCYVQTQCLPILDQLKAGGFRGVFEHDLYTDALLKPLAGTVAQTPSYNFNDNTPGIQQMKADVTAVAPNQAIDSGVAVGYLSTDMFIQALKTVAKKGKSNITPQMVQQAASTQTWKLDGVAGPVKYPQSTVTPTPVCTTLVIDKDGTGWQTETQYTCTTKHLKVLPLK